MYCVECYAELFPPGWTDEYQPVSEVASEKVSEIQDMLQNVKDGLPGRGFVTCDDKHFRFEDDCAARWSLEELFSFISDEDIAVLLNALNDGNLKAVNGG